MQHSKMFRLLQQGAFWAGRLRAKRRLARLRKELCAHVALFIRVLGKELSGNYFALLDFSHLAAGQTVAFKGSLWVLLRLFGSVRAEPTRKKSPYVLRVPTLPMTNANDEQSKRCPIRGMAHQDMAYREVSEAPFRSAVSFEER
jgi:hypothetical protein